MRALAVKQGSDAWKKARLGIVTASAFDQIVTKKRLEAAKADAYLHRLVAEWLLGRPIDSDGGEGGASFTLRGSVMEEEAIAWYAFQHDLDVDDLGDPGFLVSDDGLFGASPDALVGEDGGLEIKVPGPVQHVANLLDPDEFVIDHRGQVQSSLWLTKRKWWDLVSYHPEIGSLEVRVYPDPKYQAAIEEHLPSFLERLAEAKTALQPQYDVLASNPLR